MADPVGEAAWLAFMEEASKTASDITQKIELMEGYKRAVEAEPWSMKLWLKYSEWFWSLHVGCENGNSGLSKDDQDMGLQMFGIETALDIWEQAATSTRYRLNDSHEIWNRWISIRLEELSKSKQESDTKTAPPVEVERVRQLFLDRLQLPQAQWEEASQSYSTFLSEYDEEGYEASMIEVTKLAAQAKKLYDMREIHELQLKNATASGDAENEKVVLLDYLDWELKQVRMKPKKGQEASPMILCIALFERALCSYTLGTEAAVWSDYVVALGQDPDTPHSVILPVVQRATSHCPSSGTLWARYITTAEAEGAPHEEIENIKNAAASADLDKEGITSVFEVFVAWSAYLLRTASSIGASDESHELVILELKGALKSVNDWGKRLHGKEFKGDPLFRIERLLIQYLTQTESLDDARKEWKKLAKIHADSYEFWHQYYMWEMTIREPDAPPSLATNVLLDSIRRRTLDWPEKMMEIYIRHCTLYEDANNVVSALDTVHIHSKLTATRREREAAQAALLYAHQAPASVESAVEEIPASESPSGLKRKRETTSEDVVDGNANKKVKSIESVPDKDTYKEQQQKRDRENTTVMVTGLPAEATQTKVRQYFKEYGHINSIVVRTEADKASSTALIELRSNEDVQTALIRDGKFFGEHQISVVAATGFTLYVTNYPPQADEVYIRKLFKKCGEVFSIRWPSLKFNPHRRFCYVTFRSYEEASQATGMDGEVLPGGYKLLAKYSDPGRKKDREGAQAEGRELHVTSLDNTLTVDDVKAVFSKYGTVDGVRLLKTDAGVSKGAGFVVFKNKEDALAALALHETKLKAKIMNVEASKGTNFKHTATAKGTSASPAPDANGDTAMVPVPSLTGDNRYAQKRTITLLNIPDTINDARIRVLAEKFGTIVKVILHLKHQGAILEYEDEQSAGRAALGLANHEIAEGRKLRTGNLKDLFGEKEEIKTDRIHIGGGGKQTPAPNTFMQSSAPIRRPGPGVKGGLGQKKRGLGFAAASKPSSSSAGDGKKAAKSNADFKAMFAKGGTE
ncbi:hypothetical protein BJ878DRAFT_489617 [Calycina marina]|uniref:U4/U6 snRNA-associated-splicing factor PRP24 n=1 Tax=Calycina marina TaxID=1763456 RepID=A0A9P7ZA24_9HELO|nr:hypothetical protein BJ878DRAFT_489617 [Calycina marina]